MNPTTIAAVVIFLIAGAILLYSVIAPEEKNNPQRFFWMRRRGHTMSDLNEPSDLFKATRALRDVRRNSLLSASLATAGSGVTEDDVDDELHVEEPVGLQEHGDQEFGVPNASSTQPSLTVLETPAVQPVQDQEPQSESETREAIETPSTASATVVEQLATPAAVSVEPPIDLAVEPLAEIEKLNVVVQTEAGGAASKESHDVLLAAPEPAPVAAAPVRDPIDSKIIWPRLLSIEAATLSVAERVGILRTLGAIGDAVGVAVICEALLQESDPLTRDAALEAAAAAVVAEAIEELREAMRSPRDRERLLSLNALAAIGATQELHVALGDSSVAIATRAAELLERWNARAAAAVAAAAASADAGEDASTVVSAVTPAVLLDGGKAAGGAPFMLGSYVIQPAPRSAPVGPIATTGGSTGGDAS